MFNIWNGDSGWIDQGAIVKVELICWVGLLA